MCDVSYPDVNNWLWTPFIERGMANRIYIDIKVIFSFQELHFTTYFLMFLEKQFNLEMNSMFLL